MLDLGFLVLGVFLEFLGKYGWDKFSFGDIYGWYDWFLR